MKTSAINPDEMLKSMAAEAVKQHKQIRTTIRDLTLEALQMRELSLKQINSVVRKVTEGVNVGVGDGKIALEKALSNALAGMDEALLKVVEANKVALQKLTEGGASFEESSVKKGLKELEAFEEKFLDGVKQAAQEASDRTKEQWKSILDNIPRGGTDNRCIPAKLRMAVVTHRAGPAGPRNGSQRLARLEFCAGSGRRKGWGLRNVRGVPLPCVTTVSTTSNLGLPRSVTSLGQ